MSVLGVGIRALSTGAGLLIVGALAMSLLAGPSDKATARRWQLGLGRSVRWLAALVLLSGVAVLGWQVTVVTGRADGAPCGHGEVSQQRRGLLRRSQRAKRRRDQRRIAEWHRTLPALAPWRMRRP